MCIELHFKPGDDLEFFVANGNLTAIKKIPENETRKAAIDFPGALILNCAKPTTIQNAVDFNGFYTIDRAAHRLLGA